MFTVHREHKQSIPLTSCDWILKQSSALCSTHFSLRRSPSIDKPSHYVGVRYAKYQDAIEQGQAVVVHESMAILVGVVIRVKFLSQRECHEDL